MTDDPLMDPAPWGVAQVAIDGSIHAYCLPCRWEGDRLDYAREAARELATHVGSEDHRDRVRRAT